MPNEFSCFGEVNNSSVIPISDHDISLIRKGDIVNIPHLPLQSTVAAEFPKKGAIGIEYLNAMVVVIGHKDFKFGRNNDCVRRTELAVPTSICPKFANKGSITLVYLNAVMAGICDVNPVVCS